jgi:hypothetical protein
MIRPKSQQATKREKKGLLVVEVTFRMGMRGAAMPRCVRCETDTDLYSHGYPLCPACCDEEEQHVAGLRRPAGREEQVSAPLVRKAVNSN